jgi:hypothetical protein
MSDPIETIAEVIGGVDYDYEQRDQAKRIVSAIRTSPPLRRSLWLALTADNPLSRLTQAHLEVESLRAEVERLFQVAIDALGRETDWRGSYLELSDMLSMARDELDIARAMIATDDIELQAKDATIGQLNAEAIETGVLVADLQTGLSNAIIEVARLEKALIASRLRQMVADADDRRAL